MSPSPPDRRLDLTIKLVGPFLGIIFSMTLVYGIFNVKTRRYDITQDVENNAETLARYLSVSLSDPWITADYDKMQMIVLTAKSINQKDVVYALAIGTDGHVLASTDAKD